MFKTLKISIRFLPFFVFFFATFLFGETKEKKIYKVVILKDWKPYYATDENGKPTGYAIELFERIAQKTNLKYQYIVVDEWKDVYRYFEQKEASIIPNIGITSQREDLFIFTRPTDMFEITLFKRVTSKQIQNIDDLHERSIGVVTKNICEDLIIKDVTTTKKITYKELSRGFSALLSGEIDVFCYPKPLIHSLATDLNVHEEITVLGEPIKVVKRGIAVAKEDGELIPLFEKALDEIQKTKEYQKLYGKYFGHTKFLGVSFKELIAILSGIFLLLFLLFTIILRKKLLMTQKELSKQVVLQTEKIQIMQEEKIQSLEDTIFSFVEIVEARDTYTGGHSQRVALYGKMIAEDLRLDTKECEDIYKAGLLHDIGKIAIPDSILLKPNSFNFTDVEIIKKHVNLGCDMLHNLPMFEYLSIIIKYHHERIDGSGYPMGYKREDIPLAGNILAIADCFDAMTTSRIYKKGKSVQEAISELESLSGIHFFEEVVQSASNVFYKIAIDESINQLPQTNLEKERFAFFYKDQLTGLYNYHYLDIVLGTEEKKDLRYGNLILLSNFNEYNKQNGWHSGDILLAQFGTFLENRFGRENLVFRIFGDDFVILSSKIIEFNSKELDDFLYDTSITWEFKTLDMKEEAIEKLVDLELKLKKRVENL